VKRCVSILFQITFSFGTDTLKAFVKEDKVESADYLFEKNEQDG
jgi:hypothetical protein